jgi:hypothetical protein
LGNVLFSGPLYHLGFKVQGCIGKLIGLDDCSFFSEAITFIMPSNSTSLREFLQPLAEQHGVRIEELGNLETLSDRIRAEITAANTVVSVVPLLGAWSRKPTNTSNSCRI